MVNVLRTRLVATGICTLVLLLGQANQARADMPTQTAVNRADSIIQNQRQWIAFYMYPASQFQSVKFVESRVFLNGDFELRYRFDFKYNGTAFYGEMLFTFRCSDGAFLYLQTGGHNTSWGPGTAAESVVGIIRASLGEQAPQNLSARGILEWWLQQQ
jgi:hypothetical protein